jgi:glycosyltransferase involved in cell wall biosynthesis
MTALDVAILNDVVRNDSTHDALVRGNGDYQTGASIRRECLVSVVMPCFNERATILAAVKRVLDAPFRKEVIVVDDGSNDGTGDLLRAEVAKLPGVRVFYQAENWGKGAALQRGFFETKGDIVIVQDADLEYDPREIPRVVQPIVDGDADVVFGSRFLGGPHRVLYYWHSVANRILTTVSNMITDLNLTDMETCYKAFRADVLRRIELEEPRFGFEPEVTVKVSRLREIRVYEVPISYHGRTYAQGKKIGVKDAIRAMYCLARYGIFTRP